MYPIPHAGERTMNKVRETGKVINKGYQTLWGLTSWCHTWLSYLSLMFSSENPWDRNGDHLERSYTWENTRCVVRFKQVLQIHILKGLPSERYQVHQQRTPDLCDLTLQLIIGYTPILDSRSQTSALKWQRPRPCESHTRFGRNIEGSSSYV